MYKRIQNLTEFIIDLKEVHEMSSIYMYMYEQKLAVHDHMNVFEGESGRGLFKCCSTFL